MLLFLRKVLVFEVPRGPSLCRCSRALKSLSSNLKSLTTSLIYRQWGKTKCHRVRCFWNNIYCCTFVAGKPVRNWGTRFGTIISESLVQGCFSGLSCLSVTEICCCVNKPFWIHWYNYKDIHFSSTVSWSQTYNEPCWPGNTEVSEILSAKFE